MHLSRLYIMWLVLIIPHISLSQAVDNTQLYRSINSDKYIRFNYENDYFTASDYYYTQGLQLELVSPGLKRFPLTKLLIRPAYTTLKYGLAIEHNAYTPMDYISPDIQYNDRPFAAALFLKSFVIATDTLRHQRIVSTISAGIIGPGAGGNEMQTSIHKWTGNPIPKGWHNQVANDIVLNYQLNYEKQLLAVNKYLLVSGTAQAYAGTLSNKATIGITAMAGYFNSPFRSINISHKKFYIYLYDHPAFSVIGYDATLQGGIFNHNSIYTINAKDISRAVFSNHWGIILNTGKLYIEYFQSKMTKEFKSGTDHGSGGIQIGLSF